MYIRMAKGNITVLHFDSIIAIALVLFVQNSPMTLNNLWDNF